jgi:hypothetical protein
VPVICRALLEEGDPQHADDKHRSPRDPEHPIGIEDSARVVERERVLGQDAFDDQRAEDREGRGVVEESD